MSDHFDSQGQSPSGNPSSRHLSPEFKAIIHAASLDILETTGMSIGSVELRKIAQDHGLTCDGDRIRFCHEDIDHALKCVGRRFTLRARNPAYTLEVSPGTSFVGMGRCAPFIALADGRQRAATATDYVEMIKLGQLLDVIQLPGPLAFPGDIDAGRVHRFMMVNQVLHTDKPLSLLHEADIDIVCMAFGIDSATLAAGPDDGVAWAQTTLNVHSPLALTKDQGDYLIAMARVGIPMSISPTPAAGSTGPCSLAGNVILNNAEILGSLVLSQLVRPGLAVLYGAFPCSADMRSMVASYGGPDTRKMESAAADMAAHYRLLTRGNVCICDAQAIDYQSGAESMFNVVSALEKEITFLPGCGISTGFAMASREKLVLDAELIAAARCFSEPIGNDDLEAVVDLIKSVGPKGCYLTTPHTFSAFKKELFQPVLFSRLPNEQWVSKNRSLYRQATQLADEILNTYEMPVVDPLLKKHLEAMQ